MTNNSNSKRVILESALELFSSRGYDAVSVNEIVQKAGVTKPTLYYFYESKEGVFQAILKEKYGVFNKELMTVCKYEPHTDSYFNDVYPVLLNITNVYFDYVKKNKTFYLMMLSFMFAPPTSQTSVMVKPYFKEHYKVIIDVFIQIADVHRNLKGKEEQCALSFIAVISSSIAAWHQGNKNLDKDGLDKDKAANIVHQFMHGVFA